MGKERYGALILAGGRSSRMGTDKTLIKIDGMSFLLRSVAFFKNIPCIENIYLSIGDEAHLKSVCEDDDIKELIKDGTVTPVFDKHKGCGPLSGIEAGFLNTDLDLLYVCAIDIQNPDPELLIIPDKYADAYVYKNGKLKEPLFALYRKTVLPYVEKLIEEKNYKLGMLFDLVDTDYIELPHGKESAFFNCNTKEDLEMLKNIN